MNLEQAKPFNECQNRLTELLCNLANVPNEDIHAITLEVRCDKFPRFTIEKAGQPKRIVELLTEKPQ